MQCVGNKAIVFCIFQAYNRLSMHQVIFIVVRSSDRGDLVEILRKNTIPYSLILLELLPFGRILKIFHTPLQMCVYDDVIFDLKYIYTLYRHLLLKQKTQNTYPAIEIFRCLVCFH